MNCKRTSLVPLLESPSREEVIGFRWVFRVKRQHPHRDFGNGFDKYIHTAICSKYERNDLSARRKGLHFTPRRSVHFLHLNR